MRRRPFHRYRRGTGPRLMPTGRRMVLGVVVGGGDEDDDEDAVNEMEASAWCCRVLVVMGGGHVVGWVECIEEEMALRSMGEVEEAAAWWGRWGRRWQSMVVSCRKN